MGQKIAVRKLKCITSVFVATPDKWLVAVQTKLRWNLMRFVNHLVGFIVINIPSACIHFAEGTLKSHLKWPNCCVLHHVCVLAVI